MGRRSSRTNAVHNLRERRRGNKTYYFYDHGGKPRREESLGSNYALAIKRWAEIEGDDAGAVAPITLFKDVVAAYRREVIPTKADRTQRDNMRESGKLLEFFNDPPGPLDAIQPVNVRQYLRWRKDAPIRANREKALLSHIWNYARDEGYTDKPNPCAGIKGFKESGRDVYVEEDVYGAVWEHADVVLRDAMDLAYLTGQRPADVVRMAETDVRDGALMVRQGKTGAKVRIVISPNLQAVIDRAKARKQSQKVYSTRLVVNEYGRPIGVHALSERFKKARMAAGAEGVQFRDLRAKAATDKTEDAGDIRQAQQQLGHASVVMTEHYVRKRRGQKVTPTR
ncbi:MAG: tyrosine-type recombinase/integrase [Rhodanobacteraceae bacterium]